VEASMRGFPQGWEVTILPDKAEYRSATDLVSCSRIILQAGSSPYMSQLSAHEFG